MSTRVEKNLIESIVEFKPIEVPWMISAKSQLGVKEVQLAAQILVDYNLGIDKLKRHYDWSGKNCPRILLEPDEHQGVISQTWEWFKSKVEELI